MNWGKLYHKSCRLSIYSVFLLFLAGGLVRVTGSGMGCPDWPKCFGEYIPPTNANQLPENYKEIFLEKREKKIERMASFLKSIGMETKARKLQNAPELRVAHAYSFKKAYIEYGNRIIGVLSGLFVLIASISVVSFWKTDRRKVFYTWLGLFFILFNGWLGAIVVSTNLMGGIVTAHFVGAMFTILFLMLAYWRGKEIVKIERPLRLPYFSAGLLLVFTVIQVISGTQVREQVDVIFSNSSLSLGLETFNYLGLSFNIHRVFSILSLLALGMEMYRVYVGGYKDYLGKEMLWSFAAMMLQILTGSANVLFDLPGVAQVIHIFAGSVFFGLQVLIIIKISRVLKPYLQKA